MTKAKLFISILLTLLLFSCSQNIIVKENSNIAQRDINTEIQLKDKHRFQSNGFQIQNNKVTFPYKGKQKTLPLSEIKQITTTDRWSAFWKWGAYGFGGGALFGLLVFPFESASVAGWSILIIPIVALEGAAIGAASGMLIGEKHQYTVEK